MEENQKQSIFVKNKKNKNLNQDLEEVHDQVTHSNGQRSVSKEKDYQLSQFQDLNSLTKLNKIYKPAKKKNQGVNQDLIDLGCFDQMQDFQRYNENMYSVKSRPPSSKPTNVKNYNSNKKDEPSSQKQNIARKSKNSNNTKDATKSFIKQNVLTLQKSMSSKNLQQNGSPNKAESFVQHSKEPLIPEENKNKRQRLLSATTGNRQNNTYSKFVSKNGGKLHPVGDKKWPKADFSEANPQHQDPNLKLEFDTIFEKVKKKKNTDNKESPKKPAKDANKQQKDKATDNNAASPSKLQNTTVRETPDLPNKSISTTKKSSTKLKDKLKKISAPQQKRRLSVQLDQQLDFIVQTDDEENEAEIPIVSAEPLDEYLEEEKNIQHFLSKHTSYNMLLSQQKLSSPAQTMTAVESGIAQESKIINPPHLSPEKKKHSIKYSVPNEEIDLMDLDSGKIEIRNKSSQQKRDAVSSPNMNLRLSLQKSNNREENNESRVKLNQSKKKAKKQDKDYHGAILSQAGSAEPYIRRTIATLGWREVPSVSDKFHIKFDVLDENVKVNANQYYNHFVDNRQLTTKAGLCKNLWQQCPYEHNLKLSEIFPRCYDLSDEKSAEFFLQDFQQTAILSVIKVFSRIYKTQPQVEKFIKQYDQKRLYENPKVYVTQYRKRCQTEDQHSQIETNEPLQSAYIYAKQLLRTLRHDSCDKPKKRMLMAKITDEQMTDISTYQQSIARLKKSELKNQNIKTYLKVKICRLDRELNKLLPQYKNIDGVSNIWVVKPSYNSRGLGIYLAKNIKDIIQLGKKAQSKIVQKYIEQPCLIKSKYKFDIRQWVLVSSWDPLDAYIFDSAYIRLCSDPFSLDDLADPLRHLSNYSIQKEGNQEQNEKGEKHKGSGESPEATDKKTKPNELSSAEFETYLKKLSKNQKYTWKDHMLPKIEAAVYRTLKCFQDSQQSDAKNCFEVYGFDLMLDDALNPWVIEINLSPACSERQPWLTKMLDDMSLDMLHWLERKILLNPQNYRENFSSQLIKKRNNYIKNKDQYDKLQNLNHPDFYEKYQLTNKWQRIKRCAKELQQFEQHQAHQLKVQIQCQNLQLEAVGEKASLRYERKLDQSHFKQQSAQMIQRLWRGHRGRRIARKESKIKMAIRLQKFVRMKQAQAQLKLLKIHKASLRIQSQMRRILAKREKEYLAAVRMQRAKHFVATRIASHFKRKRAMKLLVVLRHQRCSIIIQKYIRGSRASKLVKEKLYRQTMLVRIQRFYKRRYSQRFKKAIMIQKYMKGMLSAKHQKSNILIGQATRKLGSVFESRKSTQYFRALFLNHKAVTVQSHLRKFLAKAHLKSLRQNKARSDMQKLFQAYLKKQVVILTLRRFRIKMKLNAYKVQKSLRKYLFLKRLKELKLLRDKTHAAVKVQKFLKGYWTHSRISRLMQLRSRMVLVIQKYARMWRVRKEHGPTLTMMKNSRLQKKQAIENLNEYLDRFRDGRSGNEVEKAKQIGDEIQTIIHKSKSRRETGPMNGEKPKKSSQRQRNQNITVHVQLMDAANQQIKQQQQSPFQVQGHTAQALPSSSSNKFIPLRDAQRMQNQSRQKTASHQASGAHMKYADTLSKTQSTFQRHPKPKGQLQVHMRQAEKNIKELEDQFYGRQVSQEDLQAVEFSTAIPGQSYEEQLKTYANPFVMSHTAEDSPGLSYQAPHSHRNSQAQNQVNKKKRRSKSKRALEQQQKQGSYQITTKVIDHKRSFAENLKNILSKQQDIIAISGPSKPAPRRSQQDHHPQQKHPQQTNTKLLSKAKAGPMRAADFLDEVRVNAAGYNLEAQSKSHNQTALSQEPSQLQLQMQEILQVQKQSSQNSFEQAAPQTTKYQSLFKKTKQGYILDSSQIQNRPIRDPRQEALQNLESRNRSNMSKSISALSMNDNTQESAKYLQRDHSDLSSHQQKRADNPTVKHVVMNFYNPQQKYQENHN